MGQTMTGASTATSQFLSRFGEQSIAGSQYALKKLGVDRANCSIKIEEYIILCVPFQLGLKRSIFLASLSKQELAFFQKYANTTVGLSIALNPNNRPEPMKFFIRANLSTLGQMKGRENVGLFVLDYKNTPDEMIKILGNYLETQERLKTQYDDYGNTTFRMTPEVAKNLGYNTYATITEQKTEPRRIQVFSLSSKTLEHMEAVGSPVRIPGSQVSYQLFFRKYRVNITGMITNAEILPQGLVRTIASLEYSPELVEILDDYWYNIRTVQNSKMNLL